MKKIFTLIAAMMIAATSFAKSDVFQFCDKAGNVIADGSTITATDVEVDDIFGDVNIFSGLSVKNTAAAEKTVRLDFEVESISNGSLSVCFPSLCTSYSKAGKFSTASGKMTANQLKDMATEWKPILNSYGECKVKFTLCEVSGLSATECSTVTVTFKYADPAGVNEINASMSENISTYDVLGRRSNGKGITIQKRANGKAKKVLVK